MSSPPGKVLGKGVGGAPVDPKTPSGRGFEPVGVDVFFSRNTGRGKRERKKERDGSMDGKSGERQTARGREEKQRWMDRDRGGQEAEMEG